MLLIKIISLLLNDVVDEEHRESRRLFASDPHSKSLPGSAASAQLEAEANERRDYG